MTPTQKSSGKKWRNQSQKIFHGDILQFEPKNRSVTFLPHRCGAGGAGCWHAVLQNRNLWIAVAIAKSSIKKLIRTLKKEDYFKSWPLNKKCEMIYLSWGGREEPDGVTQKPWERHTAIRNVNKKYVSKTFMT